MVHLLVIGASVYAFDNDSSLFFWDDMWLSDLSCKQKAIISPSKLFLWGNRWRLLLFSFYFGMYSCQWDCKTDCINDVKLALDLALHLAMGVIRFYFSCFKNILRCLKADIKKIQKIFEERNMLCIQKIYQ